jgi:hypothetical protein
MSILGADSIDQVLAQRNSSYWSKHSQLALAMGSRLVFTDPLYFEWMYNRLPVSARMDKRRRSERSPTSERGNCFNGPSNAKIFA